MGSVVELPDRVRLRPRYTLRHSRRPRPPPLRRWTSLRYRRRSPWTRVLAADVPLDGGSGEFGPGTTSHSPLRRVSFYVRTSVDLQHRTRDDSERML